MPRSGLFVPRESLSRAVRCFLNAEEGATMIEYALIIACFVILLVGSLTALGGHLQNSYGDMANSF